MSLKKRISVLVACVLTSMAPTGADAANGGISLLRDAEIENTIRTFAAPLFGAAGVEPNAVKVHIVNDTTLNAFVAEGLNLFINAGLLMRAQNADQVVGVIAHESGHIAGGHLSRLQTAIEDAQTAAIAAALLGIGAAVATGHGDIGSAVMAGGQDAALKGLLAFSRTQEASADNFACNSLESLGQSPKGLLQFMELLGDQELLVADRQDPYVRTHPLTKDRVENMRACVAHSHFPDVKVKPEYEEMFQRTKAKLNGFLESPVRVFQIYRGDETSVASRYARSIAYYRQPDLGKALPLIDSLLAEKPKDPYFHELKAQMLEENGRAAEALPEYRAAVANAPDEPLLRASLGHLEIEIDDPALLADASANLQRAVRDDNEFAGAWQDLAIAYGHQGDEGMASEAMAEYALLAGRPADALYHADRALTLLKRGSPAWLRAEDVRARAERQRADRRR